MIANPRSIANPRIAGAANQGLGAGASVGDCLTDTFVVSGGGKSSPVICGTNTGQHSKIQLLS